VYGGVTPPMSRKIFLCVGGGRAMFGVVRVGRVISILCFGHGDGFTERVDEGEITICSSKERWGLGVPHIPMMLRRF
jgi:hypothetical protein